MTVLRHLLLTLAALAVLLALGQAQAGSVSDSHCQVGAQQIGALPFGDSAQLSCEIPQQTDCCPPGCLMKASPVVELSIPELPVVTLQRILATAESPLTGFPSLIDHPPTV